MYEETVIATEAQEDKLYFTADAELATYARENKHSDNCAQDVARAKRIIGEFLQHNDIVAFEEAIELQDTFVRDYFAETLALAEEYINMQLLGFTSMDEC